jgi:ATP-dependent Lon protease
MTIPRPIRSFEVGTLASVLQLLKLPDGTVKVLVEGAQRGKVLKYTDRSDYYEASAVVLEDVVGEKVEAEALARSVVTEFENYVKLNKKVSPEVVGVVQQIEDYAKLADTVASHLAVKIPDKQQILETMSVAERLEKVLGLMESEISVLQVEKRIRTRVKRQMEKTQREYYLNEQMKAIQKELGDEDGKDELAELEDKIKKTKLSKEAREKATHELKKLRQMSPMSPRRRSCATTSTGCCRFRGTRRARSRRTSRPRRTFSTTITSAWRRSRSASSSISPCSSAPTS